jgi:hypothetical protein
MTYRAMGFVNGSFNSSEGGAGGSSGKWGVTAVKPVSESRAESTAGERGSSIIILIDTNCLMNQIFKPGQ